MKNFFDDYEKLVKPTMTPVKPELEQVENLFEVEEEKPIQTPPTVSGFNEEELIEKISSRLFEKLSKINDTKEE